MTERKWQKGQILQFLGCKHADGSLAPKGAADFIEYFHPGDIVKVHSVNPVMVSEYPYVVFPVDFDPLSPGADEVYEEVSLRENELGELNLGSIEDYV